LQWWADFYVVSRIDDIEEVSARVHEMLPSVRMAIAHGQMPESELEQTYAQLNSAKQT
jgi:transcription-repair coupling factor (superfamily II helicase)